MIWIEWVEPYGPNSEPMYCRVSSETAVAYQKDIARRMGSAYGSDQDALDDFIVVNWATSREEP